MTVRDWIAARAPRPPQALEAHVLGVLGAAADGDASRTTDVCLAAAERALRELLDQERFDRGGALDLLTVDALTTYAYEHASAPGASGDLDEAAARGLRTLGRLATPDV